MRNSALRHSHVEARCAQLAASADTCCGQALKECHKAVSPNIDSLENELADKIGKQQRARMSSLQACRSESACNVPFKSSDKSEVCLRPHNDQCVFFLP